MRAEKNNIFYGIDWILVILYIALVGFGWMNIYAATTTDNNSEILDLSTRYGKQLLWILLCIPLIILILFFNSKFYEKFASILYLIGILSLIGLFIFGKNINGAQSWYSFGSASFQPSEFAKAFTALAIAKLLSDRQYNLKLIKNQIKAFIIIFLPAFLIALQPDLGSVLVYLSFFFVLNREGLTLNYITIGALAIILFLLTLFFGPSTIISAVYIVLSIILFYFLKRNKGYFKFNWYKILGLYVVFGIYIFSSGFIFNNVFEQHQRDRFEILLGLSKDTKKIGYNTDQSIQAISSGGGFGKGFLQGDRTQGNFVPEQDTDYIFSTVGEEWGFVGSASVIILFMLLLYRVLYLAETHKNKFGRIYGYSLASILFFHVVINIGMVTQLLPTVGIPLPFFSYGGSSLWGFTLLLFIFIKLDANKSYDW
ncbi:Peptidoglycan glycosyltransferase MrdB [Polaribacter huanghezhanensis]|uniref:rod shape-determining protein RodA n=1 Tax=Polaribacter huanghezhanensis TaxID=1354726 RepID=UPI0026474D82|nr:rod shape-determining protein RodA [Polaribacter huanghezhanensis]WKD84981.1 Peptidoglycan glycosyltransferase MrdB [Polaribacter huanghezhanensis]